KLEVASLLLHLRVSVYCGLQSSQFQVKLVAGLNDLLESFVEVLAVVFIERTTLVHIQVVVNLVEDGSKVFQQIMNLLAPAVGDFGIGAELVDGQQAGFSKLNVKL